jgi:hypothetical protein
MFRSAFENESLFDTQLASPAEALDSNIQAKK